MEILITVLALSIVIFVHECGHFFAAKWAGIGVYQFSVGFGPKLFSFTKDGTLFVVRLLPLGGFVKLAGMDKDEDCDPKLNFYNKSINKRAITISAGAVVNIISGLVLFFCIAFFAGTFLSSSEISEVIKETPAHKAQLLSGDIITEINGIQVDSAQTFITQLRSSTSPSVQIKVLRDNRPITVSLDPIINPQNNSPMIGVYFKSSQEKFKIWQSLSTAVYQTTQSIKLVFSGLYMMFSGQVNMNDIAGPIGVIQLASSGLKNNIVGFVGIMAMISINLGVINLFPFPVLDGGHLMFLGIEKMKGSRLSPKWEIMFNNAGALVLLTLMMFLIYNDVSNWGDRFQLLSEQTIKTP